MTIRAVHGDALSHGKVLAHGRAAAASGHLADDEVPDTIASVDVRHGVRPRPRHTRRIQKRVLAGSEGS